MNNSQKINNDPNPYTLVNLDGNIIGRVSSKQPNGLVSCRFEPREEYDNNPNPILVAFREEGAGLFGGVEGWVQYGLGGSRCKGIPISPGHSDHARKVLTKLVNVYGNKEEQQ